jgi:hypothetical protein
MNGSRASSSGWHSRSATATPAAALDAVAIAALDDRPLAIIDTIDETELELTLLDDTPAPVVTVTRMTGGAGIGSPRGLGEGAGLAPTDGGRGRFAPCCAV